MAKQAGWGHQWGGPLVDRPLWREHVYHGAIHLVAAQPKEGKSGIAISIAAELTREGHKVLYLAAERRVRRGIIPRLEKSGAVMKNVRIDKTYKFPRDIQRLRKIIRFYKFPMVIIDPIAAHIDVKLGDDVRERTFITPMAALAEETDCAIVIIHHTIKRWTSKQNPLELFGGSGGGMRGQADLLYLVGKHPDEEDERILFSVGSNDMPLRKQLAFDIDEDEFTDATGDIGVAPFFTCKGEIQMSVNRILEATYRLEDDETAKPPTKLAAAEAWLTDYLFRAYFDFGKEKMLVSEIIEDAKQYDIKTGTLRKAASNLGIVTTQEGNTEGKRGRGPAYWALQEEMRDAMAAGMDQEDDDDE